MTGVLKKHTTFGYLEPAVTKVARGLPKVLEEGMGGKVGVCSAEESATEAVSARKAPVRTVDGFEFREIGGGWKEGGGNNEDEGGVEDAASQAKAAKARRKEEEDKASLFGAPSKKGGKQQINSAPAAEEEEEGPMVISRNSKPAAGAASVQVEEEEEEGGGGGGGFDDTGLEEAFASMGGEEGQDKEAQGNVDDDVADLM